MSLVLPVWTRDVPNFRAALAIRRKSERATWSDRVLGTS
jgi:hypothetical protein